MYLVPVFWVWFRLVYSLLPVFPVCQPCLVLIKDCYLSLRPRLRVPVSSLLCAPWHMHRKPSTFLTRVVLLYLFIILWQTQMKKFPDKLLTPMPSKMFVFLSSVAKKLSFFLRKTFQDFSSYSGLLWWPADWRLKNAVSMKLQRALHDPSRGIRVLSSKTIGHFKKYIYYTHFNHKCSALWCGYISQSCWKGNAWLVSSSSWFLTAAGTNVNRCITATFCSGVWNRVLYSIYQSHLSNKI